MHAYVTVTEFSVCRWQSDLTESDEVKISHAVTNFEVISIEIFISAIAD